VFYIFGAFLLYTAYKLITESGEKEWKEGKIIAWFRKKGASPLTIVLVAIAFTDLVFALDSIPAIFGLTKDPYIVFTANAFALMGLRQLYLLAWWINDQVNLFEQGPCNNSRFHWREVNYRGSSRK